jgi:phosphoribosylanthranilate isomerase
MFRIKICGVTNVEDARVIAAAGADAIGVNFYPDSKRYVAAETAGLITASLPPKVLRVGVFVNASIEDIRQRVKDVGLDLVQLHGDEPPEFVEQLVRAVALPVLRAFRLGPQGTRPIIEYLQECARRACRLEMILVEGEEPGSFGGTGKTFDWKAVRALCELGLTPVVLAGGLAPDNVVEAIETARPAAVDVASGVESSQGRKDARLVRAFVQAARQAFEGSRPEKG